jgi:hypothetical protein
MAYTPYYSMISQGQRSNVRAWLNDIPFHRSYDPHTLNNTSPAIHLLQPGENTFAIEIDRAPEGSVTFFELLIDWDHDHPVYRFEWPREAMALPEDRRVPFRHLARFTPPGDLFRPVHLDAPEAEIPCEGTPDLREAVRRVQAAVEARDLDAYCAELSLKASEFERAYPGWPMSTAADMRADTASFFRMDLRVRPLDLGEVHFEGRAGGRLVHATRAAEGGGTLIDAVAMDRTADGEGARLSMDLTFTRHRGAWKIVF